MTRQSGRTFKQLVDVLEMSAGPQIIIFVWPESRSLTYPRNLLLGIADAQSIRIHTVARDKVYRPDTEAFVKFLPMAADPLRYAGTAPIASSIVLDHFCECHDRQQFRRWMDVTERLARDVARPY